MNVASNLRKTFGSNQGRLLLAGALLSVYVNIFHTVPFMGVSDFFVVFALVALSAVTIPIITLAWNQKEIKPRHKTRLILKGMTASSAVLTIVYLVETLVGNYALKILATPVHFPISRAPYISLLISLILTGLFIAVGLFLRQQEIN